jgi:hypothetical protein
MKKCDLHIHTIATPSDAAFNFSLEKLEDYVQKMQLNVIAVTNHNVFDVYQYEEIKSRLADVIVLPGIEVDLEGGHILVIGDKDDASVSDFKIKCEQIHNLILDEKSYITFEQFHNIFENFSRYVLIPHYDKSPKLSLDVISKFGNDILAGEVTSVKKFIYMQKGRAERLTPVCFSDMRIKDTLTEDQYSTNHTYLDIDDVNVRSLRLCFMDKTKVALSKDNGNSLFQVFSNGQMLSTGLNIMYGKRSSGKSYTLNKIAEKYGDKAKYIRQFELLRLSDGTSRQFEDEIRVRQQQKVDAYISLFRNVISDIVQLKSKEDEMTELKHYSTALIECANDARRMDAYSKASLFNASLYNKVKVEEISKLIKSAKDLIETVTFRDIVEKHIPTENLKALLKELIETYQNVVVENAIKKEANAIIKDVRSALQRKSAAPRIPDIDLYHMLVNEVRRHKFTDIVTGLKRPCVINTDKVGHFTIKVHTRPFKNASDAKTAYSKQCSLAEAFDYYDTPLKYVEKLIAANIDSNQIYKLFVGVEYDTLNASGLKVSGGERSEFNFIQKIQDAALSDILIIDEPESSFDNIFLKNEVNKFIKEMSEIMPVIVSTHNNTIGSSIKPDYILYTEKKVVDNKPFFTVYSGFPTSQNLRDTNNNEVENYNTTLDSLEAGEDAYTERKLIYETLKN